MAGPQAGQGHYRGAAANRLSVAQGLQVGLGRPGQGPVLREELEAHGV